MCISWSLYQAPSFIFLPDVAHLGDRNAIFMLRLFDGDDGKRLKALAIQFYITANYNLNKKHIVKLVFVNVWFFMSFALKENIELSFLKSWLFWIGLHLIVQVIKWRLFFFFLLLVPQSVQQYSEVTSVCFLLQIMFSLRTLQVTLTWSAG